MRKKEITLEQYPVDLLNKDWSRRVCGYYDDDDTDHFLEQVREFEIRENDVWLVTLPKCGTTWMQELLWLVMNNFDFETALDIDLEIRTPFFELEQFFSDKNDMFKRVRELKSPRLIKSHLCFPMLPPQPWKKKPKTIYVFRNPNDPWVSLYYHNKYFYNYNKNNTLDEFVNNYVDSDVQLNPPLEHAAEFFELRNEPWMYYTSFECMKNNLRAVIEDVCKFLNKSITDEQMERMLKHLSFEEMKNNTKTNHYWEFEKLASLMNIPFNKPKFIREGKVGSHQKEFSPALKEKLDNYLEKESLRVNHTLGELLLLDKKSS